jgi:hypothetical protein
MSILADNLPASPSKHPGERLYDDLCFKCEALQHNGRPPRALLIGADSLASIEQFLTERSSRPMTLKEAGFGFGRKIPIIITDDENPHGITVLIEGQYF